jgi:hypothetical protein
MRHKDRVALFQRMTMMMGIDISYACKTKREIDVNYILERNHISCGFTYFSTMSEELEFNTGIVFCNDYLLRDRKRERIFK